MENYWLITTEHLKNRLWFKDEEDFKVGMNHVAVVATLFPVKIYSFILMSNHIHFVVGASENVAADFVNGFKKKYSQYFSHKYSSKELLRRNPVDLRRLYLSDESFERAVAYVQMNSVAANVCISPAAYSWGTGNLFFSDPNVKVSRLDSLEKRTQQRLVHSKVFLPQDFLVDERGYISPFSYVDIRFVESVFKTPKRMNYFLQHSSKAAATRTIPTFKDQLVSSAITDLCGSVYKKAGLKELDENQIAYVLKQVRYRFSSDPNQISRVTGISPDAVVKYLDAF